MGQPYPHQWEADVVLADGGTAHLRPITPEDAARLREFYARLSPESIYYRFFAPYPRLTERDIRHFTHVDHHNRVALIAQIGDQMVALVGYERLGPVSDEAEVAFLVEDAHQGRGLASIMLEHVAAAARERGVRRFVAEVLPDNRRMVNVFREAGYTARQQFEDGVIQLTLDLAPTDATQAVMQAREHWSESRSIARLLRPRSAAVIGASREPTSVGHAVLRHLLSGELQGPVYPVHPQAHAVAGVRAYPSVLEIPDHVDLAVIAVPAEAVIPVVEQCARKGVHGLIVVSSGFGEAGPAGRARQEELVRLARAGGMRVVGPNCLGIANTDPAVRLNATLAATLPPRGPIGFFSQSGALGTAILQHAAERGIGLSTFVSAGNRADVSGNDLLQYWEEDPATEVVLQYIESFGNPRKFTRLARRLTLRKPLVVVRSGGTTQGVPLGHAAQTITLPDHAVSSLFEQAGVLRVDDITQMFDLAQLLAYQPLPAGERVAILGNSSSLGLLAADACVRSGLTPRQPVDLGPHADADRFAMELRRHLADDQVDSLIVVFVPPLAGDDAEVAAAIREAASASPKPIVATYLGRRGLPQTLRAHAPGGEPARGSVPSYPAPEDAVRALAQATRYAAWRRQPPGKVPSLPDADPQAAHELASRLLDGADERIATPRQVADLLTCYGIEVWDLVPVRTADEAIAAAERLGCPVVLKTLAPAWRHRVDVTGLRMDLADAEDVRRAFTSMVEELGGPDTAELAVQRMAPPGVPVVVAAVEDPAFGAVVSFGLSDVTAALLDDRAYRIAPLTDADAADAVRAIRAAPLLFGHRGAPPVDVAALEDLLVRVARLADDLPEVAHLELDPVVISPEGLVVLGAVMRLARPVGPRPDAGPRRLRIPG